MRRAKAWSWGLVLCSGCADVIDLDPLDDTPPVEARVRPAPITGGTLVIAPSGYAVAADPDRDLLHVVDIANRAVHRTIALEPGDEPGRVALGADSRAHVVLRGFGGIATLDFAAGTVLARQWLCADPRGIAHDPGDASLHVACADGTLVQLAEATGEELARTRLADDLRDVVVIDGSIHVSQFRKASIVRADGESVGIPDFGGRKRHVAWRTWGHPATGGIAMLHQLASTEEVPIDLEPDDVGDERDVPYGGGGGDFCGPALTGPAITILSPNDVTTLPLANARLTVDAAISPDSGLVALAMPGIEEDRASVQFASLGGFPCFDPEFEDPPVLSVMGQVTAVAFQSDDVLVMQSREPAQLLVQTHPPSGDIDVIQLEGESRFDTAHEIFHRATESGLSCASCHPEGTDDGHVWRFEGLGKRRTQALDVDLADTAPFHWDGEMDDLDMLMSEVLAHRMGGKRQSNARAESFARWLFEQARPAAAALEDPSLVEAGQALFGSYGCATCHGGAQLGGEKTETFRGVQLQVPSLRRVSLRPPFMHDGRSGTLESAVRDMIDATATVEPPQSDVDALVAYLRTL